jgi:hypothetical protein
MIYICREVHLAWGACGHLHSHGMVSPMISRTHPPTSSSRPRDLFSDAPPQFPNSWRICMANYGCPTCGRKTSDQYTDCERCLKPVDFGRAQWLSGVPTPAAARIPLNSEAARRARAVDSTSLGLLDSFVYTGIACVAMFAALFLMWLVSGPVLMLIVIVGFLSFVVWWLANGSKVVKVWLSRLGDY